MEFLEPQMGDEDPIFVEKVTPWMFYASLVARLSPRLVLKNCPLYCIRGILCAFAPCVFVLASE